MDADMSTESELYGGPLDGLRVIIRESIDCVWFEYGKKKRKGYYGAVSEQPLVRKPSWASEEYEFDGLVNPEGRRMFIIN